MSRFFSRCLVPNQIYCVLSGLRRRRFEDIQVPIVSIARRTRWEREREREREERERERENTLQDHIIHNEMRTALHMCLPDNFFVCWHPATALSVFHGNVPQEIWGTFVPHRESTSWNFLAKIRNSLRPILALIWCRNFQDRTIPVGGDTWPSFCRKEE